MSTLHEDSAEMVSFMETIELSGGRAHTGHIIARLGWDISRIKSVAEKCSRKIQTCSVKGFGLVFKNRGFLALEDYRRRMRFQRMCGTAGLVHTHKWGYVDPRKFGDAG